MGSLEPLTLLPCPQRILVIGGGPAGLVTLRNLIQRGEFSHVELVERRDDVGGVWYLDDPTNETSTPHWPSPAYPNLTGNVLPTFLSFSSYPPFLIPPNSPNQPFPMLQETHEYLRTFAAPFVASGKIKLNTEAVRVEELPSPLSAEVNGGGWKVVLRDWKREEHWDAVVVAVGWYDNPVWPSTPGLDILCDKGVAKHAKEWRGAKGYERKKILIIGNANSSNDIAAHLAPVAHVPIYQSQRREPWFLFKSLPDARIHKVSPVVRYEYTPSGHVSAYLEDGTVLEGVDYVLVGTGYRPSPKFIYLLPHLPPSTTKVEPVPLIPTPAPSPTRIPNLHRLILHAHNPTLSFIGAVHSYTPFITADLVSTWLAFAWSFPELSLYPPSIDQRLVFERERLKKMEERRKGKNPSSLVVFSILGEDEDEYVRALRREVVGVDKGLDGVLPSWSEEMKERVGMYGLKEGAL
ncbi:hypothetical protein BDQ17DRAFT_1372842, partial [Cyathus striatus]